MWKAFTFARTSLQSHRSYLCEYPAEGLVCGSSGKRRLLRQPFQAARNPVSLLWVVHFHSEPVKMPRWAFSLRRRRGLRSRKSLNVGIFLSFCEINTRVPNYIYPRDNAYKRCSPLTWISGISVSLAACTSSAVGRVPAAFHVPKGAFNLRLPYNPLSCISKRQTLRYTSVNSSSMRDIF